MAIIYHEHEQGSLLWLESRCGIITASRMSDVLSYPKLEPVKGRSGDFPAYAYELASERINGFPSEGYCSAAMDRGTAEEPFARSIYAEKYAPVKEVGFVTNDAYGFKIGCSPDGIVGDNGGIEIKSRDAKHQVKTAINEAVPDEYMLQIQTSLLVTGREWWDFVSYSNGMEMIVKRVLADKEIHGKILTACSLFDGIVSGIVQDYRSAVKGFVKAERIIAL